MYITVNSSLTLKTLSTYHNKAFFKLIDENRARLEKTSKTLTSLMNKNQSLKFIQHSNRLKTTENLAIIHEGRLIGAISIFNIESNQVELGYFISLKYQGFGLMKLSLEVVIKYCLTSLNKKQINLEILSDNIRSIKLATSLNFESSEAGPNKYYLTKSKRLCR